MRLHVKCFKKKRISGDTKVQLLGNAPLLPLLIKMAIPSIISMSINAIYSAIDSVFIGQYLGSEGLAAGTTFQPLELMVCQYTMTSLAYGASVRMSTAFGERRYTLANYNMTLCVCVSLVVTAVANAAFVPCLTQILEAIGAEGVVLKYAYQYAIIIFTLGMIGSLFSYSLGPLLRCENRAVLAMGRLLVSCVLNIIFHAIFFVGIPSMEFYAASVSTVLSQYAVGVWMILNLAGVLKGGVLRFAFRSLTYSIAELHYVTPKPAEENPTPKEESQHAFSTVLTSTTVVDEKTGLLQKDVCEEDLSTPHLSTTWDSDDVTVEERQSIRNAAIGPRELPDRPDHTSSQYSIYYCIRRAFQQRKGSCISQRKKGPAKESKFARKHPRTAFMLSSVYKISVLGIPSYVNFLAIPMGVFIGNININRYAAGDSEVVYKSAIGLGERIILFLHCPAHGFYQAFASILGFNLGARKYTRVSILVNYAGTIMAGLLLAIWAVCEGAMDLLMKMFVNADDVELMKVAPRLIRIIIASYPLVGFLQLGSAIAQMEKRPFLASFLQLNRVVLCMSLQFVLPEILTGNQVEAIFYAYPIADLISGIVALVFYCAWIAKYRRLAKDEIRYKELC